MRQQTNPTPTLPPTLRISYRFEVPDLEDAAPRTAKTPLAPSGLMLHRSHEKVVLAD